MDEIKLLYLVHWKFAYKMTNPLHSWLSRNKPLWWQMTAISFENRNKEYGGYEIRKQYERSYIIGFLISVALILFFLFLPKLIDLLRYRNSTHEIFGDTEIITEVTLPNIAAAQIKTDIIKPVEKKIEKPQKPKVSEIPKVVKETTEITEEIPKEIPKQDEPKPNTDQKGSNTDSSEKTDSPSGSGKAGSEEAPFHFVDIMPQFPGGQSALNNYLSTNLNYPSNAASNRVEGIVLVGFIVDHNGSIRNIKILKNLYYSCDEEAIRVIRHMPQWIPGKHHGERVSVNYRIPIIFKLSRG